MGDSTADSESYSIWRNIRKSATELIMREPLMSSILNETILSHETFVSSVAHRFAVLCAGHNYSHVRLWQEVFVELFINIDCPEDDPETIMIADLCAVYERDPACESYFMAYLYFKGVKALQGHRLANCLYKNGRKDLAFLLQCKCSESYGVDIHPAATIGRGLLIDHATGVVIGETAVMGMNCSILHNVTLGSTGKDSSDDRHPKIGDNVLIGCNASVLGNINIGDNSKIGAGSIVLKPIPPKATAVGNPAKVVSPFKQAVPAVDLNISRYGEGCLSSILTNS